MSRLRGTPLLLGPGFLVLGAARCTCQGGGRLGDLRGGGQALSGNAAHPALLPGPRGLSPGCSWWPQAEWSLPPPAGSSKGWLSFFPRFQGAGCLPAAQQGLGALRACCGSRCGLAFSPRQSLRSRRQGPERVGDKAGGSSAHLPGWRCIYY